MDEREQVEHANLQVELRDAMLRNDPRYLRARRVTDQIFNLMRDFIPRDRDCQRRVEEHLMEKAFAANVEIIQVRPEWDAMDKLKIESAMHDLKMAPIQMPIYR